MPNAIPSAPSTPVVNGFVDGLASNNPVITGTADPGSRIYLTDTVPAYDPTNILWGFRPGFWIETTGTVGEATIGVGAWDNGQLPDGTPTNLSEDTIGVACLQANATNGASLRPYVQGEVVAGQSYILTYYVNSSTSGDAAYLTTTIDGQVVAPGQYVTSVGQGQDFHKVSVTFTATQTYVSLKFDVAANALGSGTATLLVDAVSIVPIDHVIGVTTADADGNWTIAPTLDSRHHTLEAIAYDNASQASAPSGQVRVTVTPNAVTTYGTGRDEIDLNLSEQDFSGNALVQVSMDGQDIGGPQEILALHAQGQHQTFRILGDFRRTTHNVTVRFLNDAYGGNRYYNRNAYIESATYDGTTVSGFQQALGNETVTIAIPLPSPPAAPTISVGPNPLITQNAYALAGTAPANSTVTISDRGVVIGTTTADGSGTWAISGTAANGTHAIAATATDQYGITSADSPTLAFTVDPSPPSAPTIDAHPATLTNQPNYALSGTAQPNATVTILDSGTAVGTTIAGSDGSWTFSSTAMDGPHQMTAVATDAIGTTSPASATTSFTVGTSVPRAPVLLTQPPSTALQSTFTLSGTGQAGNRIDIIEGGVPVGGTTVDANGTWSYSGVATDGNHALLATATDVFGNTSPGSNTANFLIDGNPPTAPTIDTRPDTLTNHAEFRLTGTAKPGSIVTLIDTGNVIGTAPVDETGAWTYVGTASNGMHQVTASATDALGVTSPTSGNASFTIDVTAPAAPTITTPETSGNWLSGTAEPRSTVDVTDDGVRIDSTTTSADGKWQISFTPSVGRHHMIAHATDTAGNVSEGSPALDLTIDPAQPPANVGNKDGAPPAPKSVVQRFRSTITGGELLTTNQAEQDLVRATRSDLTAVGPAFGTVPSELGNPNVVGVFRFFDIRSGDHFYTADAGEAAEIDRTRQDMIQETVAFNEHATAQNGDVAVYRYFDTTNGNHIYATSQMAQTHSGATMVAEGIAFYAPLG